MTTLLFLFALLFSVAALWRAAALEQSGRDGACLWLAISAAFIFPIAISKAPAAALCLLFAAGSAAVHFVLKGVDYTAAVELTDSVSHQRSRTAKRRHRKSRRRHRR